MPRPVERATQKRKVDKSRPAKKGDENGGRTTNISRSLFLEHVITENGHS